MRMQLCETVWPLSQEKKEKELLTYFLGFNIGDHLSTSFNSALPNIQEIFITFCSQLDPVEIQSNWSQFTSNARSAVFNGIAAVIIIFNSITKANLSWG